MGVLLYSTGNSEQVLSEQSQFFHSLDVVWSHDLGEKPFLDRSQWEFTVLQWCVSRDHNVAHHGRTGRAHLTSSLRNRTPTKQLFLHRHPERFASPSSFLPSTPGDFFCSSAGMLSITVVRGFSVLARTLMAVSTESRTGRSALSLNLATSDHNLRISESHSFGLLAGIFLIFKLFPQSLQRACPSANSILQLFAQFVVSVRSASPSPMRLESSLRQNSRPWPFAIIVTVAVSRPETWFSRSQS